MTSYRNYRNNESSICCDNFNEVGEKWCYSTTETVDTGVIYRMHMVSAPPFSQGCNANVKLILIEMEICDFIPYSVAITLKNNRSFIVFYSADTTTCAELTLDTVGKKVITMLFD